MPASWPPCAPCSPCPGPRSGTCAPGSSSWPCCSGCSASCCWVSGAVGGGGGAAGHRFTRPRPAGTVSLLLLVYLVFTSFWPISALYLAWVIFDWDTPEKGTEGRSTPVPQRSRQAKKNGRRRDAAGLCGLFSRQPAVMGFTYPIPVWFAGGRRLPCLRRWPVWRHFRDYFPVKVQSGVPGGGAHTQKEAPGCPRRARLFVPHVPCLQHPVLPWGPILVPWCPLPQPRFAPAAGEDARAVPQPQLHHRLPPPRHPLRRRLLQLRHGLHRLRRDVPGHPALPHHPGWKFPPAPLQGVPDERG